MQITNKILEIQNPWWSNSGASDLSSVLEFDPVLSDYSCQKVKLDNIQFNEGLETGQATYYYGAPGSGKSTYLKLFVKKLLTSDKVMPENILYYSCQNLESYEQVNEVIKVFLDKRNTTALKYIFLDDLNFVKNWEQGLNYLETAGKLSNVQLFLAGSARLKEKSNRKLAIQVKHLATLDFKSFLKLLKPDIAESITDANYQEQAGKLNYYLDIYLLTGGMMPAIVRYCERGAVPQLEYENYLSRFNSIVAGEGRQIVLMRQIIEQIIVNIGKPIGYNTIARRTKAKTHLTVVDYVGILESMFIIKQVCQADDDGLPTTRKSKKVYFQDPFYYWLFYSYVHSSLDFWSFSRQELANNENSVELIENLVFSHLIKVNHNSGDDSIMCTKDIDSRNGISFLAATKDGLMPVIIRYFTLPEEKDYEKIKKINLSKGLIITENEMDLSADIKKVPLIYFLLNYRDLLA